MKAFAFLCLLAFAKADILGDIGHALGGAVDTVGDGIVGAANTVGDGLETAAGAVAGALPGIGKTLGT